MTPGSNNIHVETHTYVKLTDFNERIEKLEAAYEKHAKNLSALFRYCKDLESDAEDIIFVL